MLWMNLSGLQNQLRELWENLWEHDLRSPSGWNLLLTCVAYRQAQAAASLLNLRSNNLASSAVRQHVDHNKVKTVNLDCSSNASYDDISQHKVLHRSAARCKSNQVEQGTEQGQPLHPVYPHPIVFI